MRRHRLLWKIIATVVGVALLSGAAAAILLGRQIERTGQAELRRQLHDQTRLLAAWVASDDTGSPSQDRLTGLTDQIRTRFTIIAPDGQVLADTHADPDEMDNHQDRPEVRSATVSDPSWASRFSPTRAEHMHYCALRLADGRVVRSAMSGSLVDERIAEVSLGIAAVTLLAVVAAIGIGIVIARQLTRPLNVLTANAAAMAAGDLDRRSGLRSRDEIGTLASAFDDMAAQLSGRIDQLTAERTKLASILGGMVEGVVAVDADQLLLHLNIAARRQLEVRDVNGIGRPLWELVRNADFCAAISEVLHDGVALQREFDLLGKGPPRKVEVHADVIRDGDGQALGAVAVIHDVTDLRHLEAVRRDFVANVSHEIKTPLAAIIGFIETVLDDPAMAPAVRQDFLGRVDKQAQRLGLLVTDLLTLSRIEHPDTLLAREPVEMTALVRASSQQLQATAKAKQVTLSLEPLPGACTVQGDGEFLRQAIDNLIDNAIKYTPPGGRVQVRLTLGDGQAQVAVSDDGIGITKADQERIFERFYRVDKARSRHLGGTGLGLAIVKHIAISHGGTVTVDSSPGRGSTFTLHLPLAG